MAPQPPKQQGNRHTKQAPSRLDQAPKNDLTTTTTPPQNKGMASMTKPDPPHAPHHHHNGDDKTHTTSPNGIDYMARC